jgi:uncharacterized SAM-binding protein YcdF (DUF218 family)
VVTNELLAWIASAPAVIISLLGWMAWRSESWTRRWPVINAAAFLWGFGAPAVADRLLGVLEDWYPGALVERCPTADAIVVPGGILHIPRAAVRPIEWADSVDRFELGVVLWRSGQAGTVVFTGGSLQTSAPADEGEELRLHAKRLGVPKDSIVVTAAAENTSDEATQVRRLAAKRGSQRILLITSAYRAMVLFGETGLSVVPVPVDYRGRGWNICRADALPAAGRRAA